MPLTLSGPQRLGLGLWNSLPGTLAAEFAIFAIGLLLYLRETAPRDRIGSMGLWSLVGFMVVVYLASVVRLRRLRLLPRSPGPRSRCGCWSSGDIGSTNTACLIGMELLGARSWRLGARR